MVLSCRDSELIKRLNFRNSHIELELGPEPTKSFWKTKDGRGESYYKVSQLNGPPHDDLIPSDELLIIAENEEVAENALSIIIGGALLAYPDLTSLNINLNVNNVKEFNSDIYIDKDLKRYYKKKDNIGYGCFVYNKIIGNTDMNTLSKNTKLA